MGVCAVALSGPAVAGAQTHPSVVGGSNVRSLVVARPSLKPSLKVANSADRMSVVWGSGLVAPRRSLKPGYKDARMSGTWGGAMVAPRPSLKPSLKPGYEAGRTSGVWGGRA